MYKAVGKRVMKMIAGTYLGLEAKGKQKQIDENAEVFSN